MPGDSVVPDGPAVKRLRRSRGWTQEDVTQRIQDRTGPFSKRTLQKIEAGRPVHLRSIRLVAEELGTDVKRLVREHVAPAHNLPSPLTSFIGREKELAEVEHLLELHRLVVLTGTGGGGKSRLALEVARDLIPDYSDGVWLVELAPLTSSSLVPQALASALGIREDGKAPLTERLADHLRNRRMLLVLDNCEHLIDPCARLVGELLPACPELRFLATSRETLNLDGEATYLVPPLQLPEAHQCLDELRSVESVRLFVERAAAVRADFVLTESNAPAVLEICRQLDGIPLALELAAARVRSISVEGIAERLADRFRLLTDGPRDKAARHRTLRALIDWSYDTLSDAERMLFRRLSLFVGGWDLSAAEYVCAGDDVAAGGVLDVLSSLVSKSLVFANTVQTRATDGSRYRFLDTVRQYALERLMESEDDASEFHRRFRSFFLALARRAEPHLTGPDQAIWLSRLSAEHDNLRAAFESDSEDSAYDEVGLQLAAALGRFWDVCGYQSEGRTICTELLGRTEASGKTPTRATVLRTTGRLNALLGDIDDASVCYEESLAAYQELGDEGGVASSLNELGVLASDRGKFDRATELYAKSLAIRSAIGDRRGVSDCLMNQAIVAQRQGDLAASRSLLEESLAMRRDLGDERGIAKVLVNLGNVAYVQHDVAEAHLLYTEGLRLFQDLGDKHSGAQTLNNLGNVAGRRHDLEAARSYYEEALSIARELGNRRGEGTALQNLGNVAAKQCDYPEASRLYEKSIAISRELGNRYGVAHLLSNLGTVARHQGMHAEARLLVEEGLEICRELGDRPGIATSLGDLELMAWREGDHVRARSLCVESLALWRELDDTAGMAERLVGLGCIEARDGHVDRAIRLLASGQLAARRIDIDFDQMTSERIQTCESELRRRMPEREFAHEWSAGETMDVERAVEYALDA